MGFLDIVQRVKRSNIERTGRKAIGASWERYRGAEMLHGHIFLTLQSVVNVKGLNNAVTSFVHRVSHSINLRGVEVVNQD